MPEVSRSPLGEIVSEVREITTSKKDSNLPYIGLEHIDSGSLTVARTATADSSVSVNYKFKAGDILFGKLRPALRKCVQPTFPGYCSTDILVLRPLQDVDSRFAAWSMSSDKVFSLATRDSEGTRMPRISWQRLRQIPIFVPLKPEQQRIAGVLDTVDEQIDSVQRTITKRSEIRAGLLRDSLQTLSATIPPNGWLRLPLGDVIPSVDYGISHALTEEVIGLPVLRMNNVGEGRAGLGELKYCPQSISKNLLLKYGDVLFNRTNSIEHIGRSGMWRSELPCATFASYLVRLNVNSARLDPRYLALWLSHPITRQRVRAISTPAVQQVNVNPTKLLALTIDLPASLDEQQRIAKLLDITDAQIAKEQAELNKLRALKTGLMGDLLTGRVRVTRGGEITG